VAKTKIDVSKVVWDPPIDESKVQWDQTPSNSPVTGGGVFDMSRKVDVPVQTGSGSTRTGNRSVPFSDELQGMVDLAQGAGEDIIGGVKRTVMSPIRRAGKGIAELIAGSGALPVRARAGVPIDQPGPDVNRLLSGAKDVSTAAADAGITATLPWTTVGANIAGETLGIPDESVAERSAEGISEGLKKILAAGKRFVPNLPMTMQAVVPLQATAGAMEAAIGGMTPTSKFLNWLTKMGPLTEKSDAIRTAMAPVTEFVKPTSEEGQYASEIGDFVFPLGIEAMLRGRSVKGKAIEGRSETGEGRGGENFNREDTKGQNNAGPIDEAKVVWDEPKTVNSEQSTVNNEKPGAGKLFDAEGFLLDEQGKRVDGTPSGSPLTGGESNAAAEPQFTRTINLDTKRGGGKSIYDSAPADEYPTLAALQGVKIKPEYVIDRQTGKKRIAGEYLDIPSRFLAKGNEEGISLARATERVNELRGDQAEPLIDNEVSNLLKDEAAKWEKNYAPANKLSDVRIDPDERIILEQLDPAEKKRMQQLTEQIGDMAAENTPLSKADVIKAKSDIAQDGGKEKSKAAQVLLQEIDAAEKAGGVGVTNPVTKKPEFIPMEELEKFFGKDEKKAGARVPEEEKGKVVWDNAPVFALAGAIPFFVSTGDDTADKILKLLGAGSIAGALGMLGQKKTLTRAEKLQQEYLQEKVKQGDPSQYLGGKKNIAVDRAAADKASLENSLSELKQRRAQVERELRFKESEQGRKELAGINKEIGGVQDKLVKYTSSLFDEGAGKDQVDMFGEKEQTTERTSEDYQLQPEKMKNLPEIAVKYGGKIYSSKPGINGVFNHADVVEKNGLMPVANDVETGFLNKAGEFVKQGDNLKMLAALGITGAGIYAASKSDDPEGEILGLAIAPIAGIVGKMSGRTRGTFDAMQRHVRGMYEMGEIKGNQLGIALREVAKEYVTKGDGRFLPVEEQREILAASGALSRQMMKKMASRDYKLQTSVLEFARNLENEDRKHFEKMDEMTGGETPGKSLLQSNWISEFIWEGMKDRILNEINTNGKYASIGAEGRKYLFKTVERTYAERIKRSIESITGVSHGLGPEQQYAMTSGGLVNPYERLKDISTSDGRNMDLWMMTEKVFGDQYPMVKKGLLDPFDDAKGAWTNEVQQRSRRTIDYVINELGIKKGSRESAVVQNLGEGAKFYEFDKNTGRLLTDNSLTGKAKRLIGRNEKLPIGETNVEALPSYLRSHFGEGAKIIPDTERHDGRVAETILVSAPYTLEDAVRDVGRTKAENARKAVEYFRKEYDQLLVKINQSYSRIYPGQPDKLVRRRADYFRHFNELQNDLGGLLNIFESSEVIDPRLAGISADTAPKRKWQSFAQQRFGVVAKEDAVGGYFNYMPSAAHAIHIDPMIQRFRAFADVLGESTVKSRNINNYILELRNNANTLAGKTESFDRGFMDRFIGRTGMRALNRLNGVVKANAVMANLGSALVQPANITQGYADLGKGAEKYLTAGIRDAFVDMATGNAKSSASRFLNERFLDKTLQEIETGIFNGNVHRAAMNMMRFGDELTARVLWHANYGKAISEGILDPVRYADGRVRRAVGGRGIGELPAADRSKVLKLFFPFMREVRNTILLNKEAAQGRNWRWLARYAAASFVMNQIYKYTLGDEKTFDPLGAMVDAFKLIDENDNLAMGAVKATGRLAGEVLGNIPMGQTVASIYPQYGAKDVMGTGIDVPTRKEFFGRTDPTRFSANGILASKALTDPLYSLLPPFGGQQIKKTVQGIKAVREGGVQRGKKWIDINDLEDEVKAVLLGPGATTGMQEYYGRKK